MQENPRSFTDRDPRSRLSGLATVRRSLRRLGRGVRATAAGILKRVGLGDGHLEADAPHAGPPRPVGGTELLNRKKGFRYDGTHHERPAAGPSAGADDSS